MITTFWDLCPDIILDIFSYFSIDQLFVSFYPDVLPNSFELLNESHTKLNLCLTNDTILTAMLLSLIDINQVVSLEMSSVGVSLKVFKAVRSITFKNIRIDKDLIYQIAYLPSLQRLILVYSQHLTFQIEETLRHVFRLRSLKYLELNSNGDHLSLSRNLLEQSLSIKQLIVKASCSQLTLSYLFNSLPRLRVLRLRTLMDITPDGRNQPRVANAVPPPPPPPLIYHLSLRIIDIVWYHPTMTNITVFLSGIRNLEQCRLSGIMSSKELNGKFWYNLLTKTCQKLKTMNINMLIWTGTETDELKTNFDQDSFFERIDFTLNSHDRDKELSILIGDYRRLD